MELQIFYHILAGLILFGALASASPVPQLSDPLDSLDDVQNDDEYDYSSDDQSIPSSDTRSTVASPSTLIPYFEKNDLTVSTIVGKNATLECDAKNLSEHVILWYKNDELLTTGKEVLSVRSQEYALNRKNYALTIVNASEASQGEYYCEVEPQKIRLHTTLVVSEQPIEAIIPESSKSSQESLYFKSTTSVISSVIGIFLFLRI